ncbi:MAG: hypothetical protein H6606_00535 [Flavobacteriales bacterium]|nr:hypothetical protein [Flavobacteriales bacterium]
MAKVHRCYKGLIRFATLAFLFAGMHSKAQQISWNYGVQPNFNIGTVLGNMADSFSSRSSVGFATFLEAQARKDLFSCALAYGQNRFYQDERAETHLFHSAECILEWLRPLGGNSKTALNLGFIPSYILMHEEKVLDGSKTSGLSVRSVPLPYRLDYGIKAGLSFQVSKGVDLQINYQEFLRSNSSNGIIKPKGDLLQFGLRLRLNELEIGRPDYSGAIDQMSKLKDGVLVIVLTESDTQNPKNNRKPQHLPVEEQIRIADSMYTFSRKAYLMSGQLAQFLETGDATLLNSDEPVAEGGSFFIARIGRFFLADNNDSRSGLFLYSFDMNSVQEPLPAFTPYRSTGYDYDDRVLFERMFGEFNAALLRADRNLNIPLE